MNTLITMHNTVETFFMGLLERFPKIGFLFATVPTGSAAVSFWMDAKNVLTFISLILGIIVGFYAWRAHALQIQKLKAELEVLNKQLRG